MFGGSTVRLVQQSQGTWWESHHECEGCWGLGSCDIPASQRGGGQGEDISSEYSEIPEGLRGQGKIVSPRKYIVREFSKYINSLNSPNNPILLLVPLLDETNNLPRLYGEGNGTPLQYSCLENPMDAAWWAAVRGVTRSPTRLSDFTFTFHFPLSCVGEGNGNPLQCSYLENPRDRGAWWAAVNGVAQSRTRLKRLNSSSSSSIQPISGGVQI